MATPRVLICSCSKRFKCPYGSWCKHFQPHSPSKRPGSEALKKDDCGRIYSSAKCPHVKKMVKCTAVTSAWLATYWASREPTAAPTWKEARWDRW